MKSQHAVLAIAAAALLDGCESADDAGRVVGELTSDRVELVAEFAEPIVELLVAEDRQDRRLGSIVETALKAGLKAVSVDRRILDGRAAGGAHQGVLAMIRPRPPGNENDLAELLDGIPGKAFLLILDGVQDPHNLGACLRTADAAGIHAVVAPRNRAAGLTPAVRKVACGASETVPFMQVTNLARTLRELGHRNIRRIGADGHAPVSIFEADLSGSIAIVKNAGITFSAATHL